MKIIGKGQVTIPPAMRRKQGLRPQCPVELVDQPNGILVVKAGKLPRGRQALATLLRGEVNRLRSEAGFFADAESERFILSCRK